MSATVEGMHVMKFDYFMQDEALARSTWPLLKGERVDIRESEDGWALIQRADLTTVWTPQEYVENWSEAAADAPTKPQRWSTIDFSVTSAGGEDEWDENDTSQLVTGRDRLLTLQTLEDEVENDGDTGDVIAEEIEEHDEQAGVTAAHDSVVIDDSAALDVSAGGDEGDGSVDRGGPAMGEGRESVPSIVDPIASVAKSEPATTVGTTEMHACSPQPPVALRSQPLVQPQAQHVPQAATTTKKVPPTAPRRTSSALQHTQPIGVGGDTAASQQQQQQQQQHLEPSSGVRMRPKPSKVPPAVKPRPKSEIKGLPPHVKARPKSAIGSELEKLLGARPIPPSASTPSPIPAAAPTAPATAPAPPQRTVTAACVTEPQAPRPTPPAPQPAAPGAPVANAPGPVANRGPTTSSPDPQQQQQHGHSTQPQPSHSTPPQQQEEPLGPPVLATLAPSAAPPPRYSFAVKRVAKPDTYIDLGDTAAPPSVTPAEAVRTSVILMANAPQEVPAAAVPAAALVPPGDSRNQAAPGRPRGMSVALAKINSKLLIEKRVLAGAENVLSALSGKKRKSKRQKQQVAAAEAMATEARAQIAYLTKTMGLATKNAASTTNK